jgi:hypothetical protein
VRFYRRVLGQILWSVRRLLPRTQVKKVNANEDV